MNKVYQVGIIGLGVVGERLLKQFVDHPRYEVVGYCEPNQTRLQEINEKYGEVTTYPSHQELLKNDEIDLVYLAVPPKFHHEIALNIIAHNKHILCEKPLANNINEAKEMYDSAENAGVVHAMNFPLPYQEAYFKMEQLLDEKALGELQRIEFNMHFPTWPRAWQQNSWIATREQGGFIREIGPHYLHLISRLIGQPSYIASHVDYPLDERASELGVMARLLVNEQIPFLFNGLSEIGQKEHMSLKILGEKAVLELRNWRVLYLRDRENDQSKVELTHLESLNLLDELAKKLDGEDAHLVSFEEGYQVQKVLEAILASK
ncbi:Gfo/Idh/MocA family protein [Aquisalibacillus elongatus]|uniref:Putative dehydrogenase n=1 Tax=Aquisalibacillus elongatus TaxID=485577 RepID=A0A3N5B3M2_9BACI|nr:Gfo/Idh/MocA family oxidoreductase [Aquisalibacillus elongatus]RPF52256.1 putative dehydrogenase [Aquisalibacillus elongatus]